MTINNLPIGFIMTIDQQSRSSEKESSIRLSSCQKERVKRAIAERELIRLA